MNKIFPSGAIMLTKKVKGNYEVINNDIVVFIYQSEFGVKRFYDDPVNYRYILKADSHDLSFKDLIIPYSMAQSLQIISRVIGFNVIL